MDSVLPARTRAESWEGKDSIFSQRRNSEITHVPTNINSPNWREASSLPNLGISSMTRPKRTASFSHSLPVMANPNRAVGREDLRVQTTTTSGYESDNESDQSQPLTNSPGSVSSAPSLEAHIPPMSHVKLMKYKTALCSRIGKEGGCRYENACDFAHTSQELRRILDKHPYIPIMCSLSFCTNQECRFAHNEYERDYHPAVYKTRLCNFWEETGRCPRGAYCSFAHGEDEKRSKKSFEAYAAEAPLSEADILDAELSHEIERAGCERYVRLIGGGWDKEDKEKLEFFPIPEKDRSTKVESQKTTHDINDLDGFAKEPKAQTGRLIPCTPVKRLQPLPLAQEPINPPINQGLNLLGQRLQHENSHSLYEEYEFSIHLLLGSRKALNQLVQHELKNLVHFQRIALENSIHVLQEWQNDHASLEDPGLCLKCKDEVASIKFRACNHTILGPKCWMQVKLARCPICNVPILDNIHLLQELPSVLSKNLF